MAGRILNFFRKSNDQRNQSQIPKSKYSDESEKGDNGNKTHTFFRNCEKATIEPVTGDVTGSIPEWLNGTLIRNGTGIVKVGDDVYSHLFDGLAFLHRYHIHNGIVTYSSRALESDTYKKNMAANRIIVSEFGTSGFPDPSKTFFQRLRSDFEVLLGKGAITDNCSVNVGYYGDQLYAMTETNTIRRIDPETLKTIGDKTVMTKYVPINQATAHPHVCKDGTVYNIGTNYQHKKGPHYVVIKIPPTFGSKESSYAGAEIVAEIPATYKLKPCYYHCFGITNDKIILIECPLRVNLLQLVTMPITKKPFSTAMSWNPSIKTRFHVVSLTDGKVHPVTYESEPFFASHHINAYEEDGQIVVDVAAYDRGDVVLLLEGSEANTASNIANESSVRRFVLPLTVDTTNNQNLVTLKDCKATAIARKNSGAKPKIFLEAHHLTKEWIELPRINYLYNAEKYNYFYCISNLHEQSLTTPEPDSLSKVDIKSGKILRWSSENQIPSEPVFVARPGAIDEDDGVLLSALMDKYDENRATLLILNAKDMSELAKVNFKTEGLFTATFHGQWANQTDKIHLY